MARESYNQKIGDIKNKVLKMGSLVENIINMSVTALKDQNLELARKINFEDNKIDQLDMEIEHDCMKLLALQQPIAKDLRTISTALKIITDLERMGDNAVNISKITLEIGKESLIKPLIDIPQMAFEAQEMVRLSLDAFVKEDVELALKVAEMDQRVDDLYDKVINDVFELLISSKTITKQALKLLFVGRYLERIADHSTNICERIIYMVTGELKEIN